MKYLKLFEAVKITDEMKEELDSLNHDLTLEEIENLFVDFIEVGSEIIEFIGFDKRYEVDENSTTISYIDGDSRNGSIARPATYLTYTIKVSIKILDMSKVDQYLEFRDWFIKSIQIQNILGHRYSLMSRLFKYPNGEYSGGRNGEYVDELNFYPKNILWLKKFGKPLYGLNKKYLKSFYNEEDL